MCFSYVHVFNVFELLTHLLWCEKLLPCVKNLKAHILIQGCTNFCTLTVHIQACRPGQALHPGPGEPSVPHSSVLSCSNTPDSAQHALSRSSSRCVPGVFQVCGTEGSPGPGLEACELEDGRYLLTCPVCRLTGVPYRQEVTKCSQLFHSRL